MTITQSADQAYQQAIAAKAVAAHALYEAELAAHDAHQTHVDEWIGAAHDRLHAAVALYSAANELVECLRDHHPVAA